MKKKITIVGAGISGLYLAYLLEEKFDVTILEARDRVGGRIYSIDGHDMGPSWIWSHHKEMLQLIQTLGLEIFSQYTQGYALYDTKDKVEHFMPQSSMPSRRVNGSLGSLIDILKKSLKQTNIFLSQVVQSIHHETDKVVVKTQTQSYESDFSIVTLPPRLALNLDLYPKLPEALHVKMANTATWMGHSAKCVIEFKSSFWREQGLSGFAFSHNGPLGEIHDASTATKAALFGFVSSNANMQNFKQSITEQLVRIFKIDPTQILSIHLVDWRDEQYTASFEDRRPLSTHLEYGINTNSYSDKILFSATEFSFKEGGYLEGAILRAQEIAHF
jgi:monoamine oxidase